MRRPGASTAASTSTSPTTPAAWGWQVGGETRNKARHGRGAVVYLDSNAITFDDDGVTVALADLPILNSK